MFVAVNEPIFPFPEATKPIAVFVLDQLYVVVPPVFIVVKSAMVTESPLHTTCPGIVFTCPFGLTVIVNVIGVPGHEVPPLVLKGVTVIVPVIGLVPVLVPVKFIVVVPEATSPIEGLLFVQE